MTRPANTESDFAEHFEIPPADDISALLSALRSSADTDTYTVLAGSLNIYISAIARFRGSGMFEPTDVSALLDIWAILLDIKTPRKASFAPKGRVQKEVPGDD